MQTKEARKLQEEWGDIPCEHPSLSKENYLDIATGDYACTQCGQSGWGRDWVDAEKKRRNQK